MFPVNAHSAQVPEDTASHCNSGSIPFSKCCWAQRKAPGLGIPATVGESHFPSCFYLRLRTPPSTSLPPPETVNIWQKICPLATFPTSKDQRLDLSELSAHFTHPWQRCAVLPARWSKPRQPRGHSQATFSLRLSPQFFPLREHKL